MLPPITEHDQKTLLQSMEGFVSDPCINSCMGKTRSDNVDECKTCSSVSLSGANIYPLPRSLHTKTYVWTGCSLSKYLYISSKSFV